VFQIIKKEMPGKPRSAKTKAKDKIKSQLSPQLTKYQVSKSPKKALKTRRASSQHKQTEIPLQIRYGRHIITIRDV
jgi:hypothetical protein